MVIIIPIKIMVKDLFALILVYNNILLDYGKEKCHTRLNIQAVTKTWEGDFITVGRTLKLLKIFW